MAHAPTEHPLAGLMPRTVAWTLDAACLLPVVALLGSARMGTALDQARTAMDALAGA